jgi:hypothetical protein
MSKLKIFSIIFGILVIAAAAFIYFKKPFAQATEPAEPPAIEETITSEVPVE